MQRVRDANPKASITCIGHSLGGHSCGMAGKILYQGVNRAAAAAAKRKLDKIIACDPAGPAFDPLMDPNDPQSNWRLKKTDANFVHAIHTDVALFGTLTPVGHLDVCACRDAVDATPASLSPPAALPHAADPNLGSHQPWCATEGTVQWATCSHSASHQYLIDSLGTNAPQFKLASQFVCPGVFDSASRRLTDFGACKEVTGAWAWGIDAAPLPPLGPDSGDVRIRLLPPNKTATGRNWLPSTVPVSAPAAKM